MQSRWFNAAIMMLWLATMSWLVTEKVLPPLLIGEPPNYRRIVESQRDAAAIGWRMTLGGQPLGWALSDTRLQPTGLTEIYGRVHFEALPLEEVMPAWLRSLTRWIRQPVSRLRIDARSQLTIDALGHLSRFDSSVCVDPFEEEIHVSGEVEGGQLELTVHSGEASFNTEVLLPSDALLCDALSPQTNLPGLHEGQQWTVPIYSPFWSTKNPLEIVHAQVENSEPILWNGQQENCWRVEYRSDPGTLGGDDRPSRGRLWVRYDGAVLRQQVFLFDSVIQFDRLPDDEAVALVAAAGRHWWRRESEMQDSLRWADRAGRLPSLTPSFGVPSEEKPVFRRFPP